MRTSSLIWLGTVGLGLLAANCDSQPPNDTGGSPGSLSAAIEFGPSTHDVAAVRFDVVPPDGGCDGVPIATQTVPLEAEPAPGSLEGGGSASHHFASSLFVLAPGQYRTCATPLSADTEPSVSCAQASELTTVVGEQTSELTLVSQCQGNPNGGVGVSVTLNDPPQITALSVTQSTFITVCESATIAVTASDPNGDALSYDFEVVSGPDQGSLSASDSHATFSGQAGDYVLRVTVSDSHAAETSFLFTVHVANATCVVPPEVHSIITANCSPCHTTGASGGLKLDPADVAYTSLVNHAVGAAACSANVRVVPGHAESSYVIAKLRNTPGICGQQMPRGRPPLAEEQIQTIEAWINALPH
ncbi:MAG TPA: hypothetical protein VG937_37145 [Polyangiaceae bacterium]|nr:hypothetical protein [Polyangiaceae bacterium]